MPRERADLPSSDVILPDSNFSQYRRRYRLYSKPSKVQSFMSSSDRVENPGRVTVGIIGLGSIGGVVAGLLRAVDRHDVVACVRRPIERLVVERAEGAIDVSMCALTDPAHAKPRDWVLLCTKAYDTASSAPWLARLCGPNTRVAVLQNGIGHADRLAPLIGAATVVPTIVYYNGERLAPDRVRFRRAGEYDFAVSDDSDGRAFAELLMARRCWSFAAPISIR